MTSALLLLLTASSFSNQQVEFAAGETDIIAIGAEFRVAAGRAAQFSLSGPTGPGGTIVICGIRQIELGVDGQLTRMDFHRSEPGAVPTCSLVGEYNPDTGTWTFSCVGNCADPTKRCKVITEFLRADPQPGGRIKVFCDCVD